MGVLTPARKGRMAGQGSWEEQYRALCMTPDDAAALIRDGDTIVMTSSANWPYAVDSALARRLRAIGGHIELDALFAPLDTALLAAENVDLVSYNANFFSGERKLVPHGNIQFVPTHRRLDGLPESPGGGHHLLRAG